MLLNSIEHLYKYHIASLYTLNFIILNYIEKSKCLEQWVKLNRIQKMKKLKRYVCIWCIVVFLQVVYNRDENNFNNNLSYRTHSSSI